MSELIERRDLVDKSNAWDAIAVKNATIARLQEALAAAEAERDEAKRLLKVQIAGHGLSAKAATANLIRARAAEDKLASLPALLAETRKKALEECVELAKQRGFLSIEDIRSLSNEEAPK